MKHEILKKTLLYWVLAYFLGLGITLALPIPIAVSLLIATVSESASLGLYYTYEYFWRLQIKRTNFKKGMDILLIRNNDKHNWYSVVEVLEDNKIVIEVV